MTSPKFQFRLKTIFFLVLAVGAFLGGVLWNSNRVRELEAEIKLLNMQSQRARPRRGIQPGARWEIQFWEGMTLKEYARCLDHFEIELGVFGTDGRIVYARKLSYPEAESYEKPRKREDRVCILPRQPTLREFDAQLLHLAGLRFKTVALHFYSKDLERQLLGLERRYQRMAAEEIRKTKFEVRVIGSGFEFYVVDQTGIGEGNRRPREPLDP